MNTSLTRDFASRHIGPSQEETNHMLSVIGCSTLEQLIDEAIPSSIRQRQRMGLGEAMSEWTYLDHIRGLAAKNRLFRSCIGMGYYNTITPPVILRNLFENPGWYTQYTPYQAEISQGRLESLLNFQTMVCDLTGLPLSNASLLDEATAAAEAMIMLFHARELTDSRHRFMVSEKVFPYTIAVLQTRAEPLGIELIIADHHQADLNGVFGAILQYPDGEGLVEDYEAWIRSAEVLGVKVILCTDLLALALLKTPGELGAHVSVGSAQRFGVPLGYGGPHAAFLSAKEEYKRQMPGRIIGVSIDSRGNKAYRMSLQTREQHIKREKATSNICTAQALLANMAAMYAVYHGSQGIREIAMTVHLNTSRLASALSKLGLEIMHAAYFDTLCLRLNKTGIESSQVREKAESAGINFRYFESGEIGISLDETTQPSDITDILNVFSSVMGKPAVTPEATARLAIPTSLQRHSEYLTHPVFNSCHSETQLMRYLKYLENKDLALNSSMISLGSCTMKLNAAAEMIPVSFPGFSQLHPFVPAAQAEGYRQIIQELEQLLCRITGLAACSLQPNSGAQGEYAGLMVIRAYHRHRGEHHRHIALIPSSAHGTNPASAVMAGMKVVVVKCDESGNVDVEDLKIKAAENRNDLAALMITYPSTHGVFEERIHEICAVIHENGGLVYMDGANMNAQVGLTSPAAIGADVCHLNLHKTFAIPHGGGGPGMGPICVNEKLAPFLPGHIMVKTGGTEAITAVSAAPWGSASILLISYGYIRMLGEEGTTQATRMAILNANYLKARLEPHYPVLYQGKNGRCAHEMILDLREFKKSGIEVEDVAKRLMDYGFHAPTVSFPVPGTLMIEPTESEDLAELDRFCEAMISIRAEIQEVMDGLADKQDNVLKFAPHTVSEVIADSWAHSYSREKAAFPADYVRRNKFWPAISRINNTYGDRNLICVCPPVESYAEEAMGSGAV